MEHELDVLNKGARYDSVDSNIQWRYGKDETGRRVIDSMEINIKVPDGLDEEFKSVVDEHMVHCCTIVRSLKRGIPVELNINKT